MHGTEDGWGYKAQNSDRRIYLLLVEVITDRASATVLMFIIMRGHVTPCKDVVTHAFFIVLG